MPRPAKVFVALASILLLGGVGMLASLSSADETAPPKNDVPAVAEAVDPLPEGAVLRLGSPRFRHPQAQMALSADGKQLITFSAHMKNVRVWDSLTGKLLREVPIDSAGSLAAIAWAPDGKTIVTAERVAGNKDQRDGDTLVVRDARTGKEIRSIAYEHGHHVATTHVCFLSNGKEIATQTTGGVGIWEVGTGAQLIDNRFPLVDLEFGASADGKVIAAVGGANDHSGDVYLWDWQSGNAPRKTHTMLKYGSEGVVVSPDAKRLALLTDHGAHTMVMDVDEGKLRELTPPGEKRRPQGAVFTPDGKKLLVGDDGGRSLTHSKHEDGGIFVWDVATGNLERHLTAQFAATGAMTRSGTPSVAVSADGRFAAALADAFPIWDLSSGKQINRCSESDLASATRSISRGNLILTLANDQPARLWDATSGLMLHQLPHQGWTRAGAISPDGKRAATSANDDLIKVWDAATGKLIMKLPGHSDMNGTSALRFSADGQKLVSFGTDFYVRVTDMSTGKAVREFPIAIAGLSFPGERRDPRNDMMGTIAAHSAVLSADGSQLCIPAGNKYQLFDTNTGKELVSLDMQPNWASACAFSPNGAQMLMVGRGKTIETPLKGGRTRTEQSKEKPLVCWDTKTGKKRWETPLQMGYMHGLAYAPDGRTFAVQSRDSEKSIPVEFRDAATGNLLGRLDKLPMSDSHVDFTADGKRVVVVMMDGTVLVCDVPDFKK